MKKISINQIISTSAKQPFTGNSLKFLQDALDEDKAAIIKVMVTSTIGTYSLTIPYVISGCVVTDSNKDVTSGEIFYGGKFYEVVGVNGTTNVAQFILTKSQDATADPVIFTDGSSKNVHDVYKYVATDAASGGDFDATDLVYLFNQWISYVPTLTGFTATIRNSKYMFKDNKLSMVMEFTSIETLGASSQLSMTLPFAVPSPKLAVGYTTCVYYDGTTAYVAKVYVRLLHTGAGNVLQINKLDGSNFAAATGGNAAFSIEIAFI